MAALPPSPLARVAASIAADGEITDATAPAPEPASHPGGTAIIGRCPAFMRCRKLLARLAPLPMPVLIRGETGTGKELAARLLHAEGPRAPAPFVAVNCAAVPPPLAESELFGHARGAFTGAHRQHQGAFARADGGTLLLDEIGELPLAVQAKLLRVLELGVVQPVGAEHEAVVHARVVAATHRDLEAMVAEGSFREDLYFRLSVLTVELPPLRARAPDIPPLIEHFAASAARELGRPIRVSEAAVSAAVAHPWRGNVRALRNAVLRAAVLTDGLIGPDALLPRASPGASPTAPEETIVVQRGDYDTMNRKMLQQVVAAEGSIRRAAAALGVPRSTLGAWLKRDRTGS